MAAIDLFSRPPVRRRPYPLILFVLATFAALFLFSRSPTGLSPSPTLNLNASPLAFVPNGGQSDPAVQFQAQAGGGALFFTPQELIYSRYDPAAEPQLGETAAPPATPLTLRWQFVDASDRAELSGQARQSGKANYFLGSDPAHWQTNLPTYGQVTYQELYPGISLAFSGQGGRLNGRLTVAPGADLAQLRWSFPGAEAALLPDGQLQLMPAGSQGRPLYLTAPQGWQEQNGRPTAVPVRFNLDEAGQIALQPAGVHKPRLPLLLDTSLQLYDPDNQVNDIVVDPNGRAYVVGATSAGDFPLENPAQPQLGGDFDLFVTAFAADGQSLIYSTYIGGQYRDMGMGIALDAAGSAYVTGHAGGDYPANPPATGWGVFVTKLSPAGDALLYSTYVGRALGTGIAVDAGGSAYVTGVAGAGFPTVNAIQPTIRGRQDLIVFQLTPDGQSVVYATYLGGPGWQYPGDITVDDAGNAYITGSTTSNDFPIANPLQPAPAAYPGQESIVSHLVPGGQSLAFSTYLGGSAGEEGLAIALDTANNVYVGGATGSTDFPLANPLQPDYGGSYSDAFITAISADGSTLLFSTYLGSAGSDKVNGIVVGGAGRTYVTGETYSADFPTVNPLQPTQAGNGDAFVAKLEAGGGSLVYSTYLGGGSNDRGLGIAVDGSGQALVGGYTRSPDFPIANAFQPDMAGASSGFVSHLTAGGQALLYSTYLGGGAYPGAPTTVQLSDFGGQTGRSPTLLLVGLLLAVLLLLGGIRLAQSHFQEKMT